MVWFFTMNFVDDNDMSNVNIPKIQILADYEKKALQAEQDTAELIIAAVSSLLKDGKGVRLWKEALSLELVVQYFTTLSIFQDLKLLT